MGCLILGPHAALPSPAEERVLFSEETPVIAVLQTSPGLTLEEFLKHQQYIYNIKCKGLGINEGVMI